MTDALDDANLTTGGQEPPFGSTSTWCYNKANNILNSLPFTNPFFLSLLFKKINIVKLKNHYWSQVHNCCTGIKINFMSELLYCILNEAENQWDFTKTGSDTAKWCF